MILYNQFSNALLTRTASERNSTNEKEMKRFTTGNSGAWAS